MKDKIEIKPSIRIDASYLEHFVPNQYLWPGCNGGPYEKELLNDLLKNYNVQNRPVMNESSPIVITFGVTLQQIVDLVS